MSAVSPTGERVLQFLTKFEGAHDFTISMKLSVRGGTSRTLARLLADKLVSQGTDKTYCITLAGRKALAAALKPADTKPSP